MITPNAHSDTPERSDLAVSEVKKEEDADPSADAEDQVPDILPLHGSSSDSEDSNRRSPGISQIL